MCIMKGIVRTGVILALVGGTAALIAGPNRLGALFDQARDKVNKTIDANISDPVALRAQLKNLEGEYPQRLEAVGRDLAEVQGQIAQLNRDLEVSRRVVALAEQDADQIQSLIAKGEAIQQTSSASGDARIVRVVFGNESINLKDAYARATRIRQVHEAYASRVDDIQRDLTYLDQQQQRLADLKDQLQKEHADFQAQMWQLDRQVDTIARNDRLIDMMERRQKTIDEQSRYSAGSLSHVSGRLADIRARQESRLQALGTSTATTNYEDRAKLLLDSERAGKASFKPLNSLPPRPAVIEVHPDHDDDDHAPKDASKTASRL